MNKVSSWSFQNNNWVVFLPWYISWRGLFRFQNKQRPASKINLEDTTSLASVQFSSTKSLNEENLSSKCSSRNIDTNCWIETSTVANRWTATNERMLTGWVNLNSHSPGLLPRVPFKLPPPHHQLSRRRWRLVLGYNPLLLLRQQPTDRPFCHHLSSHVGGGH